MHGQPCNPWLSVGPASKWDSVRSNQVGRVSDLEVGPAESANIEAMNSIKTALLCLILLLLAGCSREEKPGASVRDVNVLLITIDTIRADHVSAAEAGPTPQLARLAGRGAFFEQAVVQVPLTLPSHACILTGAYPETHGIRDNGGFVLAPDVPTLAGEAHGVGLRTAAFVGAAILNKRFGLNKGFEVYNDDTGEEKRLKKLPGVVSELRAEVVTRRALDWLESAHSEGTGTVPGKRFLLWLHYYDPHVPYDPPEPFKSRFPKDPYTGEIAYTDAQVGLVLEWLRTRNLEDQTLVFVLGDHGESLGDHGEHTHGVFLYDATMHVPMVVAGPGIAARQVIRQQVRSIDVMPTILGYLGLPKGNKAHGESLVPLLTENRAVRTTYSYMETLYPKTAMNWSELRGVRAEDWKLIVSPKPELYHLTEDAGEESNVLAQHPQEVDRLQRRVWEVAGNSKEARTVRSAPLDDQTRRELESLGYLNVHRRKEIRMDMSGPDPKDRVKVLEVMETTGQLMNHDRFEEAIPSIVQVLALDPQNPMLHARLALCYERTGRFRKAIEVYRQAIDRDIADEGSYAELGELHIRLGQLEEAIAAMEHASGLNPANLQNMTNLANAYLQSGKIQDAERALAAVFAQNAGHAGAHNLMGILLISRGQPAPARGHFEQAIAGDAELAEPYMNLGLLAQNAGRTAEAIRYYSLFLEKAPPRQYAEVIPKVRSALAELRAND